MTRYWVTNEIEFEFVLGHKTDYQQQTRLEKGFYIFVTGDKEHRWCSWDCFACFAYDRTCKNWFHLDSLKTIIVKVEMRKEKLNRIRS